MPLFRFVIKFNSSSKWELLPWSWANSIHSLNSKWVRTVSTAAGPINQLMIDTRPSDPKVRDMYLALPSTVKGWSIKHRRWVNLMSMRLKLGFLSALSIHRLRAVFGGVKFFNSCEWSLYWTTSKVVNTFSFLPGKMFQEIKLQIISHCTLDERRHELSV
jgi:hypothetical protein